MKKCYCANNLVEHASGNYDDHSRSSHGQGFKSRKRSPDQVFLSVKTVTAIFDAQRIPFKNFKLPLFYCIT